MMSSVLSEMQLFLLLASFQSTYRQVWFLIDGYLFSERNKYGLLHSSCSNHTHTPGCLSNHSLIYVA